MLEIRNLNFKFKEKVLYENMYLNLSGSKVFYLIGDNGCGKTTLARILNKEIPVESGVIKINGRDINEIDYAELRSSYLTYLEQETVNYDDCTLNQLINTFSCASSAITQLITDLEYEELCHRKLKTMSGGERQKALIIFSLSKSAPLIIMDEFDNNLDSQSLAIITNFIYHANKTFIIISHKIEGDNTLKLTDKQIAFNEDINETTQDISNHKIEIRKLIKFHNTKYIFFKLLFIVIISLVIFLEIFVAHKYLSRVNEYYGANPVMAEQTADNAIVVYSPLVTGYADMNGIEMYTTSSDDLYFDEEDLAKLQASDAIISAESFAYPLSSVQTGVIPNTSYSIEFSYSYIDENGDTQNAELNITNLLAKQYMYEGMPSTFGYEILYGTYPTDESNEILIPSNFALYLIQNNYASSYEAIIGQAITLPCSVYGTNEQADIIFQISGIYESSATSSSIMISYHESSSENFINDYYRALEQNDQELVYENAYNEAKAKFSAADKELTYEEFVNNNPDLIEAVYIEVANPEDVTMISDAILAAYPNAVIYSQDVYATHAPYHSALSYLIKALKRIAIIFVIFMLFLLLVNYSYNVKYANLRKVYKMQGVSKLQGYQLIAIDYIIPIFLGLVMLIICNSRIGFGSLWYPLILVGAMLIIIANIAVIELCIIISKNISKVLKNVKNR